MRNQQEITSQPSILAGESICLLSARHGSVFGNLGPFCQRIQFLFWHGVHQATTCLGKPCVMHSTCLTCVLIRGENENVLHHPQERAG